MKKKEESMYSLASLYGKGILKKIKEEEKGIDKSNRVFFVTDENVRQALDIIMEDKFGSEYWLIRRSNVETLRGFHYQNHVFTYYLN